MVGAYFKKGRRMTQLESALDRLLASLVTLETAAEARLANDDGSGEAEALIEELRADRDRLALELEAVPAESVALEQVTDEVAVRLDGAISGIREVLEG